VAFGLRRSALERERERKRENGIKASGVYIVWRFRVCLSRFRVCFSVPGLFLSVPGLFLSLSLSLSLSLGGLRKPVAFGLLKKNGIKASGVYIV
jgi:hypothetical protein